VSTALNARFSNTVGMVAIKYHGPMKRGRSTCVTGLIGGSSPAQAAPAPSSKAAINAYRMQVRAAETSGRLRSAGITGARSGSAPPSTPGHRRSRTIRRRPSRTCASAGTTVRRVRRSFLEHRHHGVALAVLSLQPVVRALLVMRAVDQPALL